MTKAERFASRVLTDVAEVTGFACDAVAYGGRKAPLVQARRAWWWLVREMSDASISEVGRISGHHHTTVLHGVRLALEPGSASRAIIIAVLRQGGAQPPATPNSGICLG